ncbi:MAG: hypothetical protein IH840_03420 [Candidatus Heimdallarchaeota archaeon]|nr:hypothetical protein [Candidatus Heimdallarchaeota archaeon]
MRHLSVFKNRLSSVPVEIGMLNKMEYLNLGENQLEQIPNSISNMKKLQTLLLHRNKLVELPEEIVKLIQLKELWIIGNKYSRNESKNPLAKLRDQISIINPLSDKRHYLSSEIDQWLRILEKNGCNIDGFNPSI